MRYALTAAAILSLVVPIWAQQKADEAVAKPTSPGPTAEAAGAAAGTGPQTPAGPGMISILSDTSYWRWYAMDRPVVYARTEGDVAERKLVFSSKTIPQAEADTLTLPPPANWNQPDFDDGDWPRSPAKDLGVEACGHVKESDLSLRPRAMGYGVGGLLVRGRFNVRDPQKVREMTFSLTLTGGAVVYVNGRKLAAVGMPEGDITLSTPAKPYEPDAYQDANKKPVPDAHSDTLADEIKRKRLDPGAAERAETRKRSLTNVAVPAEMLRPGVNVIAVEVHRSDFAETAKLWRTVYAGFQYVWAHLCIWDVSLSAAANDAVDANVQRPAGFQVWNLDRNVYATDSDWGDPTEPLRPLVLVGARNGTFSGRVMASSRAAIKALKAEMSDLVGPNGKDSIAAGQVKVRYSDDLEEARPKEVAAEGDDGAVCSVWVTVRVPKTLPVGTYKGTLAVSADAEKAVTVPVELQVADWTLPDPLDFKTIVGIYQSPTSVALQYDVPMWSEEHWKRLDRSFELLAGLGSKFASITVVDQGMLGEEDGEVIWKAKADGTYEYDYAILERHLKLIKKHLGKCPNIVLNIWQFSDNQSRGYTLNKENILSPGTTVTTIDAAGRKDHPAAPAWDAADCEAFWRPVLLGIRDVFKRNGLEESMCVGFSHDGKDPPEPVAKVLDNILGHTRWIKMGHPPDASLTPRKVSEKGFVVYHEAVYTRLQTQLKSVSKLIGSPNVLYVRRMPPIWDLMVWRTTPVWALFNSQAGFGHIGLDFWPVVDAEGKVIRSSARYVNSGHNVHPSIAESVYGRWLRNTGWPGPLCPGAITRPGDDGARVTLQYESLREGLQDFEALLFIMVAAENQSGKIGDDLARRAGAILAEQRTVIERGIRYRSDPPPNTPDFTGWQDLSRRIFALAGEVDRALSRPED